MSRNAIIENDPKLSGSASFNKWIYYCHKLILYVVYKNFTPQVNPMSSALRWPKTGGQIVPPNTRRVSATSSPNKGKCYLLTQTSLTFNLHPILVSPYMMPSYNIELWIRCIDKLASNVFAVEILVSVSSFTQVSCKCANLVKFNPVVTDLK